MIKLIKKIKESKKIKIGIVATTLILSISVAGIIFLSANVRAEKLEKVNKNITEAIQLISADVEYMDQEQKDELEAIEKEQTKAYKSKDIEGLKRLEKKIMDFKGGYVQKIILGYQNKIDGLALPAGANDEENQKLVSIKSEVEKEINNNDSRLDLIIEKIEKAMKDVESLALSVTNRIAAESSQVATNTPSVTKPGTVAPKPTPKPTAPTPKPAPVGTMICYYYVADTHWDSSAAGVVYGFKDKYWRDLAVTETRNVPGGWIVRTWEKEMPVGSCF